ncbi:hypothetical protein [Duncaniella muris]|uniref:hypothetical protein n=1 Tax=Duncaniella muris TaxID=2094150 RepID=UPI0025A54100|nr:hypothetical protein [Duncaniella muris]
MKPKVYPVSVAMFMENPENPVEFTLDCPALSSWGAGSVILLNQVIQPIGQSASISIFWDVIP